MPYPLVVLVEHPMPFIESSAYETVSVYGTAIFASR
jgi:hypothetical protein